MNIENVITSLCEKFSVTVAQLSNAVVTYHRVANCIIALICFIFVIICSCLAAFAYKKAHAIQDHYSAEYDTWQGLCIAFVLVCAVCFLIFVFASANFCIWSFAPDGAFVNYLVGLID